MHYKKLYHSLSFLIIGLFVNLILLFMITKPKPKTQNTKKKKKKILNKANYINGKSYAYFSFLPRINLLPKVKMEHCPQCSKSMNRERKSYLGGQILSLAFYSSLSSSSSSWSSPSLSSGSGSCSGINYDLWGKLALIPS